MKSRVKVLFFLCFFCCCNNKKKYSDFELSLQDSAYLVKSSISNYKLDPKLVENSVCKTFEKIKHTEHFDVLIVDVSTSMFFIGIKPNLKSGIRDTMFSFYLKSNHLNNLNIGLDKKFISKLSDFNKLCIEKSISKEERIDIISYVALIGGVGLPQIQKFSHQEYPLSSNFYYNFKYFHTIKNEIDLFKFREMIQNDSIYYMVPFADIEDENLLKTSLEEIDAIIKRDKKDIVIEVLNAKKIAQSNYNDISKNLGSSKVLYFYTLPDFYLYKLKIENEIQLKNVNNKDWWLSIWTPKRNLNFISL